jgi:predicted dehydrogenase
MNPIRIGVVGLGQRIAHVVRAMGDVGWNVAIGGYSDPAPVGLPILKERDISPGTQYANSAALLKDGPFDLVMIGSPNHLHYEHLLAAFEAGFPIFAEKPIVRTEEETFALARHISSRKIPPLYIGLVMRSMPIVR